MTDSLKDLATALEARAFLGSQEVFQEAWNALLTVDGRSDTGACGRLLKCCQVCIGPDALSRRLLNGWSELKAESQINIAYAAYDSSILTDGFWVSLFGESTARTQHTILAGFAQTALRGERDKKLLRKMLTSASKYDSAEMQKKLDHFVMRILNELGS